MKYFKLQKDKVKTLHAGGGKMFVEGLDYPEDSIPEHVLKYFVPAAVEEVETSEDEEETEEEETEETVSRKEIAKKAFELGMDKKTIKKTSTGELVAFVEKKEAE